MKKLFLLLLISLITISCNKDDEIIIAEEIVSEVEVPSEEPVEELAIDILGNGIFNYEGDRYGLKFFNFDDSTAKFQLYLVGDGVVLEESEQESTSYFNETFCLSNCFEIVEVSEDYLVIEFTYRFTGEYFKVKLEKE